MTTRRIVRCTEGHPYDANATEVCPVCGAAAAGEESVAPGPSPIPPWPNRELTAGLLSGAVVIVVGAGIGLYLHRPTVRASITQSDTAAPARPPRTAPEPPDGADAAKAESEKAEAAKQEAAKAEATRTETAKTEAAKATAAKEAADKEAAEKAQADAAAREEAAKADAAKADAEIAEAAKAEKAKAEAAKAAAEKEATDRARADAARQQTPETDSRVVQFMTVNPATVEAMRRALAPVEPADSNSTLDAFSPPIERQLRLSTFLREILANERAVQAMKAHDYARTKTILSAIVSLPAIEPDIISLTAYKNLATYYARQGAPARDLAYAARLTTIALRGGLPSAAVFFATRPGLPKAAHIEATLLGRYFTAAAIQDPQMLEPVMKKHGFGVDEERSIFTSYDSALSRRDWSTAISTLQAYNDGRLPVMDMLLSKALILAPNNAAFMDRALAGAVSGGAASYSIGTDLLGFFCLEGLDGVRKDAPNAAGWLIATLYGLTGDDPNWAGSRERYQEAKSRMSPDQRQGIEQLARELGVE